MKSFYSKVAGSRPIKNSKIFQSTYFKARLWMTSTLAINSACSVSGDQTLLIYTIISQLTFTCSKSTIQTLEKGVKYVQS